MKRRLFKKSLKLALTLELRRLWVLDSFATGKENTIPTFLSLIKKNRVGGI